MRCLVDEDVDEAVADFLESRGHEVQRAREVFGVQTKDNANVAWCWSNQAILVTGDKRLATVQRAHRRCGVLLLRDLGTAERARIESLHDVIVAEHRVMGHQRFWMSISTTIYAVGR